MCEWVGEWVCVHCKKKSAVSTLKPSHIAHFFKRAICDGFSVSTALFSIIFYSVL